ncbi:oxidoreductase [Lactococcus hodotermopsidis]|uniref:Oxidoreductase n=1 Tax=Pseudolactococcus hodotermopsidis TaxID=2709157 RepID=A0A6A0BB14_9LACT|nr:Gfo/Idh/MocA family oxidoreductase [Lactococcus hodotermopsidis]GFH41853.1 oxidoreductase [Lactococcus hodotermopsidis]
MKIGIIGAGNIALKAYVPTYSTLQDVHDFVIYSRDRTKAINLQEKYNFLGVTTELSELYASDIVFIHAATPAHFELAHDFLSNGVHVFMDKPISEDFSEVLALQNLAKEKNLLFIIGFNRRFAPRVTELKAISQKNIITVTKNRINETFDLTYGLYDLFIHPLDTLIYLLDDEIIDYQVFLRSDNARLRQIVIVIETVTETGIARLNAKSGANTETITVESETATYHLLNLTDYQIDRPTGKQVISFKDWDTTLYKRGFEPMVKAVLTELERFDGTNREEIMQKLKQTDVVRSHEMIAEILA